ncbi:mandelate racemase/muconate lactonizing enzyme family protein [Prosthecobacter sp.]|uniref:mandelate racemase/muconate lactonizing enzyme family protein n=1 Tax=Prosthecobacter sp. TaxID=1965333 RepID=UPI00378518E4
MKITAVRTLLTTAPQRDIFMKSRVRRSAALILIETDTELTGLGETYAGYFVPEMVPEIVKFYEPILVGQSPLEVDVLSRRMFTAGKFWARVGLGSIVLSGIESALLDLKGKALGVPVYELLGGRCHETLPCYATGGTSPHDRGELEGKVAQYLSLGFHAVKLGAGLYRPGHPILASRTAQEARDVEVSKVEFLRERFGDTFQLNLDAHMDFLGEADHIWNLPTAQFVLQALEAYPIGFFEEALPYTDMRAYGELRRSTTIPVAGGETLTSLEEWRDWLEHKPFALAQLDASFMGGMMNFIKIARLCELQGVSIATHAWSATPGVAANLHAAFASRNTAVCEMAAYNPTRPELNTHIVAPLLTDLWIEPPVIENGRVRLADTPGLGVRLPEAFLERYPFEPGSGEFSSVTGKVLRP